MKNLRRLSRHATPLLVLAVGIFIGIVSEATDSIPYQPAALFNAVTLTLIGAGLINSLFVWFTTPLLIAYCRGLTVRHSLVIGAGVMAVAIIAYGVASFLFTPPGKMNAIPSFMATLLVWLCLAIPAGMAAGWAGFKAQQRPLFLSATLPFVAADLLRRGASSWNSPISTIENTLLFGFGAAILVYATLSSRSSIRSKTPRP